MSKVLDANNIMVDLEMMGQGSNAAIIAIGAVRFHDSLQETFYETINLQSSVSAGLDIEASTVLWWLKQSQSDEARSALLVDSKPLSTSLLLLSQWMGAKPVVWGNGSDFDNVILANAYTKLSLTQPWAFWDSRCYRTLKNLYQHIKIPREGTAHNALDNAVHQANHAIAILESL